MLQYINSPFGMLEMYPLWIGMGIVCAVLIQAGLILKVLRRPKYLVMIASYGIILYFGQYVSAFVRVANEGALDGKLALWDNVAGLNGSHFLGYLLLFTFAYYPLLHAVSALIMEPDRAFIIRYMNLTAICLPVQHIFNRLGCLSRGCCYGIAWDGPLSICLPDNPDIGHSVFPVQILEILFMVILLAAAIICLRKNKAVFGVVMTGFGVTFFVSEFFTENHIFHLGLTYVQYFSIVLAVSGIVHICLYHRFAGVSGNDLHEV